MSSVILSFYVARTFPGCCLRVLRLGLEIKCKSTTLTHDTDTLKQQLILIIKLVTSVFWFPCFNRKINQRVLFGFFFRILYCKFCVQFFNKPIHNFNRSNLQLQIMSCIFTGYLEKIRRNDDVIVLIHIPESYDFSLASKSN